MNIFRMIKCGILVSAAAVMVALCSSCGNKSNYNSKVHINEALRHMNNKYGVEFTYDSDNTKEGSDGIFGKQDSYVNILVTCKQLPDIKIVVYSSDGSEFLDDLVPKKFEHQAQADLNLLAKTVFEGDKPTVKLYLNTESEMSKRNLPADTTYEDFLMSGALGFVDIYTDDCDAPLEDYRSLAGRLMGNEINCEPSVWYFADDSYTRIDEKNTVIDFDEPEKKLGQIRVSNGGCIFDEDFDGEITISNGRSDPVSLQISQITEVDTALYNAMFLPAETTSANNGSESAEDNTDSNDELS